MNHNEAFVDEFVFFEAIIMKKENGNSSEKVRSNT